MRASWLDGVCSLHSAYISESGRLRLALWSTVKRSPVGRKYNSFRTEAFDIVQIQPSIEAAIEAVEKAEGKRPYVVTTDARTYANTISYKALRQKREEEDRPILLLLGTGYGMTKETMEKFDYILEPIYGAGEYNHLSVRSAAAIILDRLAGEAWWE